MCKGNSDQHLVTVATVYCWSHCMCVKVNGKSLNRQVTPGHTVSKQSQWSVSVRRKLPEKGLFTESTHTHSQTDTHTHTHTHTHILTHTQTHTGTHYNSRTVATVEKLKRCRVEIIVCCVCLCEQFPEKIFVCDRSLFPVRPANI